MGLTSAGDTAALWFAVVALGAYHGLNPGMGWPLAVANGLTERRVTAVASTMAPLAAGHLLAMAVVLLPFAALAAWVEWNRPVRVALGLLVAGFGVYRLVVRRHPRVLARVKPTRLALWSFLMATAHGAGLMLLPAALGLCTTGSGVMGVAATLGITGEVALVHTAAALVAGGTAAWVVYRYLGLRLLNQAWLNLDAVWGVSLVVAGVASLAAARLT